MSNLPPILVVEDNQTQQKLIRLLGGRCGYEPVICSCCEELVDVLETRDLRDFKLVLMDWQLSTGHLDGLGCTKLLRKKESEAGDKRVPIIGMTAHAMSGDRERCIEAGMDDYLSKPFTIDQLQEMLNKWLRNEVVAS